MIVQAKVKDIVVLEELFDSSIIKDIFGYVEVYLWYF